MDLSTMSPVRVFALMHLLLVIALAMVVSSALVAAALLYDEAGRMLVAATLGTLMGSLAVILVGYPLALTVLLRRAGYLPTRRRIALASLSLLASCAVSSLIAIGPTIDQSEAHELLIAALVCSAIGSLLAQLAFAASVHWPVARKPWAREHSVYDAFAPRSRHKR